MTIVTGPGVPPATAGNRGGRCRKTHPEVQTDLGRSTIGALPRGAGRAIGKADRLVDQAAGEALKKSAAQASTFGGCTMRTTLAWRCAALVACAGLGIATPALAQDKTVKIGVLNAMSSLYADTGGPNSVVAAKLAVADARLPATGRTSDESSA